MAIDAGDDGQQHWQIVIHTGAKRELANLDEYADELTDRLKRLQYRQQPTQASYAKLLGEESMFRVRKEQMRAVCQVDGHQIRVVAVGHRSNIYDRLEIARSRAGLSD